MASNTDSLLVEVSLPSTSFIFVNTETCKVVAEPLAVIEASREPIADETVLSTYVLVAKFEISYSSTTLFVVAL